MCQTWAQKHCSNYIYQSYHISSSLLLRWAHVFKTRRQGQSRCRGWRLLRLGTLILHSGRGSRLLRLGTLILHSGSGSRLDCLLLLDSLGRLIILSQSLEVLWSKGQFWPRPEEGYRAFRVPVFPHFLSMEDRLFEVHNDPIGPLLVVPHVLDQFGLSPRQEANGKRHISKHSLSKK